MSNLEGFSPSNESHVLRTHGFCTDPRRIPKRQGDCGATISNAVCAPRDCPSDNRQMSRPGVFLDLNGTLVEPLKQERLDELTLIPGVAEAVARLTAAGFVCPVVTVQSRIAKGLFTCADRYDPDVFQIFVPFLLTGVVLALSDPSRSRVAILNSGAGQFKFHNLFGLAEKST